MKALRVTLGITGGIGSGKSYFSSSLRLRGLPVYDSDSEAKKLMLEDENIVSSLKELLGEQVYISGNLNKQLLASYVFSSPENALKVNSIVHPRVKKAFLEWADECFSMGHNIVAIESAILFEAGFNDIVDKVVMIHAPLDIRISRVMARDNTSKDKVMERIKLQMPDDQKMLKSDFVIENDGLVPLDDQIDKLISEL
ncbi:dephospho-CoA kinase [Bacteroides caecigallinarum]|uniref:dephospho-CoA kinase n=1 Tax=Bacteroides caecigallinarum TaxID=1411144 RepID=UPI001EEB3EF4|nr:dephospho-CoA kinase [Bacteroides caecigallinarum]MCF2592546.1 dephospho-CoA kinase [Bacteroides caecigallinarum]